MKTYQIIFKDCDGSIQNFFTKAQNGEHAEEKFNDPDSGHTLEMIISTKRFFSEEEKIAKKYKRNSPKL